MDRADAARMLEQEGLQIVVVDSTFSRKDALGVVLEQNPKGGSHAKPGRSVYVVVNALQRKQIALPDMRDLSSRQAQATLQSMGLTIVDIRYEPSEYKDLVLDVQKDGESIEPGTMVEEGTGLELVIGFGKGLEMVYAPNLMGKTLVDARQVLLSQYLILGSVNYDEDENENEYEYVIYWQSVAPDTRINEGTRVDVRLSRDIEKAVGGNSHEEDEDFF